MEEDKGYLRIKLGVYPEIICLITQFWWTLFGIMYLIKNKTKYPIRQSSYRLTILNLVSYMAANTFIFVVRVRFFCDQEIKEDKSLQILSSIYAFLVEITIPVVFFKMFRLSVANYSFLFNRNFVRKIAKSWIIMLIIGFFWCLGIALIQYFNEVQVHEFFQKKIYCHYSDYLGQSIRLFIVIIVYIIQYSMFYCIDSNYRFKQQYNWLLILQLSSNVSRCILDIFQINNLTPTYYYNMCCYLAYSIVMTSVHQVRDYKPEIILQDNWKQGKDFQVLMGYERPRLLLKYFFGQNRKYLFQAGDLTISQMKKNYRFFARQDFPVINGPNLQYNQSYLQKVKYIIPSDKFAQLFGQNNEITSIAEKIIEKCNMQVERWKNSDYCLYFEQQLMKQKQIEQRLVDLEIDIK